MFEQIKGKLFSPNSAGAFLDISRSQVHRLITSQEIDALKLGARSTRITGDSIAAYLERKACVARKPVCVKNDVATKPSPTQKKNRAVACKVKPKVTSTIIL